MEHVEVGLVASVGERVLDDFSMQGDAGHGADAASYHDDPFH